MKHAPESSSATLTRRELFALGAAGLLGYAISGCGDVETERRETGDRMRCAMNCPHHLEVHTADIQRAIAMAKDSVVKVSGPRGHGSGFVLAPGYVLTNHHVVAGNTHEGGTGDAPNLKIHRFRGDDRMPDRVFRATLAHLGDGSRAVHKDMALLKLPPDAPALGEAVRIGRPQLGQTVIVMGNPADQDGYVTVGRVSRTVSLFDEEGMEGVPCVSTDAGVNPGNSGGPMFGIRKAMGPRGPVLIVELVGMTTYAYRGLNDMGGGIRADYIAYIAATKWGLPLMTTEEAAAFEREFPMVHALPAPPAGNGGAGGNGAEGRSSRGLRRCA